MLLRYFILFKNWACFSKTQFYFQNAPINRIIFNIFVPLQYGKRDF